MRITRPSSSSFFNVLLNVLNGISSIQRWIEADRPGFNPRLEPSTFRGQTDCLNALNCRIKTGFTRFFLCISPFHAFKDIDDRSTIQTHIGEGQFLEKKARCFSGVYESAKAYLHKCSLLTSLPCPY